MAMNMRARSAEPWIERLARVGYAGKGCVYVAMGFLTTLAGLHRGGGAADRRDALRFIAGMPLGRALLVVIAAGVVGYAVWRVLSGVTDSDRVGSDPKGLILRAGSILRGLFYGSFAFVVVRLLMHQGSGGTSSDRTSRRWTARAFDHPFGRWIVAAAGLILIGYGIYQLTRAANGKISRYLDLSRASHERLLIGLSCFGIAARAIVFGAIGVSLIRAAWKHSAAAAHGTSGAMRDLSALPLGHWILTVIGLGLIAYGIYAFINARYRRIRAR
jgi:hypothetical protein